MTHYMLSLLDFRVMTHKVTGQMIINKGSTGRKMTRLVHVGKKETGFVCLFYPIIYFFSLCIFNKYVQICQLTKKNKTKQNEYIKVTSTNYNHGF